MLERDRRARWMRHWLLRTTCIQTLEVFERREPVLLVVNEADDGLWQLIGSTDADVSNVRIGHLYHAIDNDLTMLDIVDLAPGQSASRDDVGEPWTRYPADMP